MPLIEPTLATPSPTNTSTSSLDVLVRAQKDAFLHEGVPSIETRRDRLARLQNALTSHAEELATAIDADFGTRSRALSLGGDIMYTVGEIAELRGFLPRWIKAETPHPLRRALGLSQEIRPTPLGVVGVAGPWNFPIQLSMVPAAGAIAAGNRVMIRPSSVTRRTGEVLAKAVAKHFDSTEVSVITAEYGPGSAFSRLPFDSFFFTGSPEIGREVARDCAANLVPVALELGGKNPVVVDQDANIVRVARRIAAAKLLNSGQVCLSPDYVFVPARMLPDFVTHVLQTWQRACPQVLQNPDYTSIINDANYNRIVEHIEDARELGATVHQHIPQRENLPDRESRKIPPTMITGLAPGMTIEEDEIFGPVLSIYTYEDLDDVIAFINDRPCPLTMYWYGPDNERKRALIDRTRSGSVNCNEFMLHMMPAADMPFGGVGNSGYGYYHGKYSIQNFSHARALVTYRGPVSFSPLMTPRIMAKSTGLISGLLRLMHR
ncbi:aldehyde dehydrogenase family protein [Mycobacteroides chelonae]|uniref:aldehyde dehydrogenase family protein n=1 Tax=Mycobacteroides TaxID=670516 RepID=UPI0008A83A5C|nr:aldehyde dehydrogenase family protein [Mycobacteroides chelonae]AYM43573.1 aldehyde dehydrogenase family protein [[Mycobacterium] chelonae subsp. gwanakae]OHU14925.1 coniferyl aldehyde dehydrogenase [Mycobacteroides chelonae]